MLSVPPVLRVKLPTVSWPGEFPGAIVPPLFTVTSAVVAPIPPSVPPLFTV